MAKKPTPASRPRARRGPAKTRLAARGSRSGKPSTSAKAKPARPRKPRRSPPARTARKAAAPEKAAATRKASPRSRRAPAPPPAALADFIERDRSVSAVLAGRHEMAEHVHQHPESGPALTAGDVDATWELAYSSGDEAPGGDNPTPDQDIVDDIGRALGVHYEDAEELKGADKITDRDRHRWELDPASAEDYRGRSRRER